MYSNAVKEKKEKICDIFIEDISKREAKKLVLTGEIADACKNDAGSADKVCEDIKNAVSGGGRVFIYKRRREIKAICIFSLMEHMIPLAKSSRSVKESLSDAFHDSSDRTASVTDETELVSKNCWVMTGFYVADSYEARRDELEKLFKSAARDHLMGENIPAYVWGDETVIQNHISANGKFILLYPVGMSLGILLGVIYSILFDADISSCICLGMCLGGALCFGTMTVAGSTGNTKSDTGEKK